MKRLFFAMLFTSQALSSCDKILSRPGDDSIGIFGRDEHGGNSGSGGGSNIAASSVPAAVMASFRSQFPSATGAERKKLNSGNYNAQFFWPGLNGKLSIRPPVCR